MPDSPAASFHAVARSCLFVPGLRPDRIDKALDSGAHAVIVDLEDAVGAQEKPAAREQVALWLATNPSRHILLRINAVCTPWHADDLRLASAPNVAAVVVPKAEREELLPALGGKPLLPIIESALGFARLEAIAAQPHVSRLIFGTYDFRADLGLGAEPEALLYFSSRLVLVSRVAGLPAPIDGVTADIVNGAGWVAEARRARSLGFGGKLCIHPRQVAAVNEGFAPNEDEIRWATRILDAVGDKATAVVDGEFVDRPIILRARASSRAAAISCRNRETDLAVVLDLFAPALVRSRVPRARGKSADVCGVWRYRAIQRNTVRRDTPKSAAICATCRSVF